MSKDSFRDNPLKGAWWTFSHCGDNEVYSPDGNWWTINNDGTVLNGNTGKREGKKSTQIINFFQGGPPPLW